MSRPAENFPLLADQIAPTPINPESWVALNRESGQESLEKDHARAVEATRLRDEVERLVTPADFATLCQNRTRYPKDGLYGTHFWRKQLEHVQAHGSPEIFRAPAPLDKSLNLAWLKYGNVLTWSAAPGGPKPVVVHWVGSKTSLCQMVGEPIRDYDPKLIPERNVWLAPEEFAKADSIPAA